MSVPLAYLSGIASGGRHGRAVGPAQGKENVTCKAQRAAVASTAPPDMSTPALPPGVSRKVAPTVTPPAPAKPSKPAAKANLEQGWTIVWPASVRDMGLLSGVGSLSISLGKDQRPVVAAKNAFGKTVELADVQLLLEKDATPPFLRVLLDGVQLRVFPGTQGNGGTLQVWRDGAEPEPAANNSEDGPILFVAELSLGAPDSRDDMLSNALRPFTLNNEKRDDLTLPVQATAVGEWQQHTSQLLGVEPVSALVPCGTPTGHIAVQPQLLLINSFEQLLTQAYGVAADRETLGILRQILPQAEQAFRSGQVVYLPLELEVPVAILKDECRTLWADVLTPVPMDGLPQAFARLGAADATFASQYFLQHRALCQAFDAAVSRCDLVQAAALGERLRRLNASASGLNRYAAQLDPANLDASVAQSSALLLLRMELYTASRVIDYIQGVDAISADARAQKIVGYAPKDVLEMFAPPTISFAAY